MVARYSDGFNKPWAETVSERNDGVGEAKTGEGNGGQEDEDEFLKWNMSDHSLGIFVFVSYKLAIPVYF